MTPPLTLTSFTPAETARITGVSPATQRMWRQRGLIPTNSGHARFDPFELATIWVLKMLSDRGVGPQSGRQVAARCADGIVYQALHWTAAYEGDHLRTLDWDPCPPSSIYIDASRPSLIEEFEAQAPRWLDKFTWLISQISAARPGHDFDRIYDWVILWPDDSLEFALDLENLKAARGRGRRSGAVVILDLHDLGTDLLKLSGKPLVKVSFPEKFQGLVPV